MKWIRETTVTADGKVFPYQGYEIHFSMSFDDTEDPDQANVKIYNLTPETENAIEVGGRFVLESGYQGDVGILLEGLITDAHGHADGTERICEIEAVDSAEECLNKQITKSFDPGTKASEVLDFLASESGLTMKENRLEEDVEYPRGFVAEGKVREVIKDVAVNDCKSRAVCVHGELSCIPWPDAIEDAGVTISAQTGMVDIPTRISGDHTVRSYEVKCLLDHRLRAGMVVQVNSTVANGSFLIKKGTHKSDRGEHLTILEVVEWTGNKAGGGDYKPSDLVTIETTKPPSWEDLFGPIDDSGGGGGGGAR